MARYIRCSRLSSDHDAFQCGYCTPGGATTSAQTMGPQISGQIMSAVACVHEGHANSNAEIREFMSGNLCRCACYPNIVPLAATAPPPSTTIQ